MMQAVRRSPASAPLPAPGAAPAPGFPDLAEWLADRPGPLAKGPLAILLFEDGVETFSTLRYHLMVGFRHILALSPEPLDLPALGLSAAERARITNLRYDCRRNSAHVEAVNAVIAAVPAGTWLYYGFNAEYLFYPFSDHRRVGELLEFHQQERRDAMLTYVIDLYAPDLRRHPDAVSIEEAMFDRSGYYALERWTRDGQRLERQLDFHGGLRWRFEEYLPANRRRVDRIALFRAARGLEVAADHVFNVPEYNTYASPWHHNMTAAVMSFRVAKALMRNPGSRNAVRGFTWRNSTRFTWRAQQLMDLGLMEPGQWF